MSLLAEFYCSSETHSQWIYQNIYGVLNLLLTNEIVPNLYNPVELEILNYTSLLQEAEKKAEEERIRTEIILKGNPLINQDKTAEFKVKRRQV